MYYVINGSVPNIAEVSSFCVFVVLVLWLLNVDDTFSELTGVDKGCDVRFIKVVRSEDIVVVGIVVITSVVVGTIVVVFNVVVKIGVDGIMVVFNSSKCIINWCGIY